MKIFNFFKNLLDKKNNKKLMNSLIMIIIMSIIGLIGLDIIDISDKSQSNIKLVNEKKISDKEYENPNTYNDTTEKELEGILSQIVGVGDVNVMITYETTSEVIPAMNVTSSMEESQEKDSQGGIRTTKQENTSKNIVTNNQQKNLVVIKEIKPEIRGVVVVAQGAENIIVKNSIIDAVKTVFQIPSHKVMVYEKK
ncbi:MAG: stage III sporulation protein AG [Anaeromicrobium sp.]|jgi:stage III sporulation protein AG|uniref:stage III sporulation protein AG n=1 Tax=Anaeromicrobium sp. TaxID=1929132 RepID=UPI0025E914B3|nr:stage III sporulation protein AG [Anaeromicrobium sp.]MCT4596171.1 stage III sporulation protein AG [Anaeromicrobium sp.]